MRLPLILHSRAHQFQRARQSHSMRVATLSAEAITYMSRSRWVLANTMDSTHLSGGNTQALAKSLAIAVVKLSQRYTQWLA